MTDYYGDMSESAALNYLAGTSDFGDAAAIRRIAAYIDAATGDGSPEGAVTGAVGDLYTDSTNGHLYIKGSGTGNTGWVQLESATSGSGDVNGPGSATDNALVRFDGTGGKTVQNSGITVDDSGNVSSNLTISKATPVLHVSASSGNAALKLTGAAGTSRDFLFYTDSTIRWGFRVNSSSESGSNAGSNFTLSAYNDAGDTLLGNYLAVTRAEGRLTLSAVGATAGLELGSSGPRIMSGTGSPEGVVSAPVGSKWTDTAATTGAIQWIKATGTGNTGWVVQYGDTGWRQVTASMEAGFKTSNPNAALYVRRTNDRVTWMLNETIAGSATGTVAIYVPPTGFKETVGSIPVAVHCINANTGTGLNETFYFASGTTLYGFSWTAIRHQALLSYPLASSTAWPTSLPGTAA